MIRLVTHLHSSDNLIIVLPSQHTRHSQHRDILIILPRLTSRGASCLQNIHSYNFLFSCQSSQFKQNTPRDSVSCCLLVTAQLVGRISNIFSFIIILMRPLHLPSDSSQYAPPPSDNESDQDQLSLLLLRILNANTETWDLL